MRSSISKKAKPSLPPRDAIRARALEEGFDAVGFARAQAPTGAGANLKTFLAEGHHGDPPYTFDAWPALLALLDVPLVVAESEHAVAAPDGWAQQRARRYGRTWVTVLERLA